MTNKLVMTYVGFDILFVLTGGLLIGFVLMAENNMRNTPTTDTVAQHLLLSQCPLTAGIVNAVFIFLTFLLSLPALFLPTNKGWLRTHGWMIVLCATFTLILGVVIWVDTLKTRANLGAIWAGEKSLTQSLLQQKFNCCGYYNSNTPPFIQDATCPNSLVAAQKGGCVAPFSSFANQYLDVIFTAAFGIVGVDALLLLCTVCLIKHREEQQRYRHIDEKNGFMGI